MDKFDKLENLIKVKSMQREFAKSEVIDWIGCVRFLEENKIHIFERKLFNRCDVIFAQGDHPDNAYLIDTGTIIMTRDSFELARIGKNDIFGELGVLDGSPRVASATALEDTITIVIPGEFFSSEIKKTSPFIQLLLQNTMAYLRASFQRELDRMKKKEKKRNSTCDLTFK